MSAWEWVRLIAGGGLLLCGLLIFVIEMYGVFHFKYVLNRMHSAALGDTLGIGLSMAGLMILSGFRFATLKMAMVVIFLWVTSPVSSHLLARLEGGTNKKLGEHCQVYEDLSVLEVQLETRRQREQQEQQQEQREQREEQS
ncbi:MAG: monovalent cation/H(+) antiporter subunit G [Clostridium sp.]|nr:monovalent cation/H(+) antiporter subunit G [Acetatifactor muris]MCM1526138.1 monovalent cation/H(+) antiporter subunit G [Bacteroides sp.]MCM1562714.1 monovalent cation/H(+) antiporter subunit G [Clostridium sp.]